MTLTGTTAAGCSSTITENNFVCAFPYAVAGFGTSSLTATITEPSFQFTNSSVNATGYNWTFGTEGSSSLTNPTYTFSTTPGTHLVTLIAQNAAGCNDSTTITVTVEDELIYYVPNTFTPDDDVYNPTFKPIFTSGFDPYVYNLLIFDRWGEILFESKNYQVGWDGTYGGKLVQDGTYIWVIRFNNSITDKRYEVTGHVNILR